MALDGQEILYFMSVGAPTPDQSFEERRVQDYLKAYLATGRPPQPCPQSPDTPNARAALGLAPLFVPTAIPVPADNLTSTHSTSTAPATLPADLPATHEFRSTKSNGDCFESISVQTLYSHFSHEELRYHAYRSGNKMLPVSPLPVGTMEGETPSSPVYPFYANDSRSTAFTTSTAVAGTPDYLMSIVASHKFEKHSFEELRIAHRLAGKEVGSSEIPTRGALPAQPAPTLFGRPRGDAFSSGSLKLL
ncbi:hypothetical protein HD554DRAFT_2096686 [Boletus coccyginus]|nr:hypothetical protein HD554DRAFT_2096686 [Boletus coccyginus]